jgi:hypothetical protein
MENNRLVKAESSVKNLKRIRSSSHNLHDMNDLQVIYKFNKLPLIYT